MNSMPLTEVSPFVADFVLLAWLRSKLADAEKAVSTREQAARTWRSGDNQSWTEVAVACGGKPLNKKQRIEEADRQERILIKCRHEVAMFKAVIGRLEPLPTIANAGGACPQPLPTSEEGGSR